MVVVKYNAINDKNNKMKSIFLSVASNVFVKELRPKSIFREEL